jgi:hypothetical protein
MLSSLIENAFFVIGDLLITGVTYTQISSTHAINLYYTHIHPIPIVQLFVTKLSPFILKSPQEKTELESFLHYPIEYIKNNQVIYTTTVEKIFKINSIEPKVTILNSQYDFLICSRPCDTHKTIFKKIIYPRDFLEIYAYSHERLKQFMNMNGVNPPGNQFISCSVGEESFELNDEYYNFYVSGNTFNSTFFDYLFKNYYTNIEYDVNNTSIHLIDNSADMITFLPTSVLSITEDSYEIKNK